MSVYSVEELVNTTLKDLYDPSEGIHQQVDLPPPIRENLDGDGDDFHFSDEEQWREDEPLNNNENLNSKGEESSE